MLDPGRSADRPDSQDMGDLRSRPLIRSPWVYFLAVILFDSIVVSASVLGAVRWRYDFLNRPIPDNIEEVAAIVAFFISLGVWSVLRVPRAIWRFTSLDDVGKLAQAVILVMAILPLSMYLFINSGTGFPRSAPLIAGPLAFIILVVSRLVVLVFRNGDIRAAFTKARRGRPNAVLAGSTTTLHNMLRDMRRQPAGSNMNIIGLITTDSGQIGRSVRGVPVIGTADTLADAYQGIAKKYDEPPRIIAVEPKRSVAAKLVRAAAAIGAPLSRMSPDSGNALTSFEAQDLIGRRPRSLDIEPVRRLVEGRRILISGAGGSIGSELVRQVAELRPAHLVLVEQSEFNLYKVDRQLQDGDLDFEWSACLADVCDRIRMDDIFARHRPDVVLHAAALKHVPLGEENPLETLHTNVEGTRVLLDMCVKHSTNIFTLVSTDKAVQLSNVMGASKCIAEMLTHAYNRHHPDFFACAVRFGNVLASAGSVVPLFEEQIARGGPVTVTHEDATRYFMTTYEASALVLQATALNATQQKSDSSIYVLEMGEPVNIVRLARQLIQLRGKVPDRDIEIVFSGLRPGEVLEEKITAEPESLETTYVAGLLRITGDGPEPGSIISSADKLISAIRKRDVAAVRRHLKKLLPTYTPNGSLHQNH